MTTNHVTGFPVIRYPLSQVTPFTYRDGWTFLEVLENFRSWVNREIVPIVNDNLDKMDEAQRATAEAFLLLIEQNDEFKQEQLDAFNALLGNLIGYTIEITGNVYRASMQDGSEFTAYTREGVDNEIAESVTPVADTVTTHTTEIQAIETARTGIVSSSSFGAVGDGTTDDTDALQDWLDAGGNYLNAGTYRITRGLTVERDNFTLEAAPGSLILSGDSGGTDAYALNITGDSATVRGLTIDGQESGRGGIYVNGTFAVIDNCRLRNFHHKFAQGIWCQGVGGYTITNNVIENLYAPPNGIIGDADGAARAITVHGPNHEPAIYPSLVDRNTIRYVLGEEGDAIHTSHGSNETETLNLAGRVTVSNNYIDVVSRRYIKVQSSKVRVLNNTCEFTADPSTITLNPATNIDIQYGSDVEVSGNNISSNPLGGNIAVTGWPDAQATNVAIKGNNVSKPYSESVRTNIFVSDAATVFVEDNICRNGARGIAVSAQNIIIKNNTYFGGAHYNNADNTGVRGMSSNAATVGVYATGNVIHGIPRFSAFDFLGTNVVEGANFARES